MLEFTLLLFRVTVYSSVTALLLLFLKRCLKFRIPPFLNAALWLVLFVRLIFPYLPESSFSVYNLLSYGGTTLYEEVLCGSDSVRTEAENRSYIETLLPDKSANAAEVGIDVSLCMEKEQEVALEKQRQAEWREKLLTAVCVIYAVGAVGSLSWLAFSYVRVRRRAVRASVLCEAEELLEIYAFAGRKLRIPAHKLPELRLGSSSMLCGIFRPVLIVDYQVERSELPMIFLHELNHYVHRDNAVILLSNIISAILWFNPLMWLASASLRDDLEMLCDSRTLEFASVNPARYARLLYTCADPSRRFSSALYMSAEGRLLKRRLRRIAVNGKTSLVGRWVAGLLSMVLMLCCLTNPISYALDSNAVYVENSAELFGGESLLSAIEDNVSGTRFFQIIYTTLKNRAGTAISMQLGDGSLSSFTRRVAAENAGFPGFEQYMSGVAASRAITYEQAAVILDAVVQLISCVEPDLSETVIPEQLRESTMAEILQSLPTEDAKALLSCYNRGSDKTDITYASCYSVETVVHIMEYIENEWLRSKFISYYVRVPIDRLNAEKYGDVIAATSYSYVYRLQSDIYEREEATLREILALTYSGMREDVFYLKPHEDLYSYEDIAVLFQTAGFDRAALHEEYAALGCSAYSGTPDSVGWFSYVTDVDVSGTASSQYARMAALSVCRMGLLSTESGVGFPYGETMTFGEVMHALCLLYAGMTS